MCCVLEIVLKYLLCYNSFLIGPLHAGYVLRMYRKRKIVGTGPNRSARGTDRTKMGTGTSFLIVISEPVPIFVRSVWEAVPHRIEYLES